jgi:fatty-acyl-CoA synthase
MNAAPEIADKKDMKMQHHSIGNVHWSVGKILEKWARARAEKPAIILDDVVYTYAALNAKANQFVHLFLEQGLKRGDRVAGVTTNCIEAVALYFACAKFGAICIPINNRLTANELSYQLQDSDASLLVFDTAFRDALEPAVAQTTLDASKTYCIGGTEVPDWCRDMNSALIGLDTSNPVLSDPPILDDPLAIIYTSGTTGAPKGAVISQVQTYFKCVQFALYTDMREDDVYVTHVPLFHSAGLFISLTPTIFKGATLVTSASFDPKRFIADAKKYRATVSGAVSTMLKMILQEYKSGDQAFDNIRIFLGGGERTPMSLLKELKDKTGVTLRMIYGQTENSFMTLQRVEDAFTKVGSVGHAGFLTDVWIENDDGNPLPAGQSGNIVARGPTLMSGYWKLPEKTAETIVDGKLMTGDMGYMDTDGAIFLVDRKKDMYRSGAENVYPAEIEKLLMDHPKVFNVAIIGVRDEDWGEVGKAFIVARPGENVSDAELLGFLDGKIARFKCPKHFEYLSELPMTPVGKVKKSDLKDREGAASRLA